ncbi:alpha/beta fold hydrolase [Streptomyces sp. ISL-86]|uniref:alpha/beta fold hydrolase n=1 Tax=Streptomyces sp. ISL-86 TaxID=2819187 RepID=UPI001BE990A8|nr:alpha/beta hydrolase [Streptomyces sp. ISL-86]MBT2455544.1 alpha/beta fold hydrolase [Streptomyces sp. ISL-86]
MCLTRGPLRTCRRAPNRARGPRLGRPSTASTTTPASYHKRGWGGSTHTPGPVSIADHAADAIALLDRLGIDRVHVAGHSSGAAVAAQLAQDHADRIVTVALLELSLPPAGAVRTRKRYPAAVGRSRRVPPLDRARRRGARRPRRGAPPPHRAAPAGRRSHCPVPRTSPDHVLRPDAEHPLRNGHAFSEVPPRGVFRIRHRRVGA